VLKRIQTNTLVDCVLLSWFSAREEETRFDFQ